MKKNNANKDAVKAEKRKLNSWYKAARNSLLLVVVSTVFNTVLLLNKMIVDSVFSSVLPFYATVDDFGETSDKLDAYFENIELLATSESRFLVITWIVFVVVVCLFFLAWLYSKKEGYGWLVFAFCFYLFDTLVLFYNTWITKGIIINYLGHIIVLALLARGVYAGIKLKKLSL